jgi:hypothetical protein
MTTYTAISAGEIDADSPITADLMSKLRDNPIAITEGASGAPKISAAALNLTANTLTGSVSVGSPVTLSLSQYSLFPSFSGSNLTATWANTGTSTVPKLSITSSSGTNTYTIWWNSIT